MIAAIVVPAGTRSIAMMRACLVSGRIAVFEIMINTHSVGALIRDNKTFRIATEIQTGAKYGMVSLEASLVDLYLAGVISREEAFGKSTDPEMAAQLLAGREPRR